MTTLTSMNFSPPRTDTVSTSALRTLRFNERLGAAGGWDAATAKGRQKRQVTIPGIDIAALQVKHSAANAHLPQTFRATFRCPVDASERIYEQIRYAAIETFLSKMRAQNWVPVIDQQHPPRVYPGMYPAHDLRDGVAILDQREYIVETWFHQPRPKLIRFELPPMVADDYVIHA